jgi:DNA-binding NtrC family response regulator
MVGDSMPMMALRKSISNMVKFIGVPDIIAPVLITGETGSGKELVARIIHEQSNRASGPFVAVNCAAIPDGLFQAEIFGVEKGAFTSAYRDNAGRIDAAQGGTLMLDEIGDLSLDVQISLLRFLEEGVFERLGNVKARHADVSIITATHIDLEDACRKGTFREDLFHRLNALRVRVPPLSARGRDVISIAEFYIHELSRQFGLRDHTLEPEARERLMQHTWPGNVRELRNRIMQALVVTEGPALSSKDLDLITCDNQENNGSGTTEVRSLQDCREAAERRAIASALSDAKGDVETAAKCLGISRAQLYRLIRNLGIKN